MDSTNSKNFYLVPIFILLFSGLFYLNKVTKTTDTPFDHFIFLPITAGTFLLSLGVFLIQKNKKSILCDKKVFFFSYLFGLLDTLIFHSTIKMLVNGPIINIIHALLISCCITKFFYSIPTLNVSILLGVTLAFFSFLISLTDVHLRGIVRLRSVENIMISKKVDVYFTLLTILLTLRLYYTVRTELFSDNLLPLYNSFFSFIFSLFYFLCYFNLNYFFNSNISLTIILFMIVYFFFIRIFDGKKMIYGLLVTSVLFGLIYFIKNDWFEGNMLEKHVLMYHTALFGGIFLLGYCEKYLVFRRIAFTVWFIELVGF